MMNHCHRLIRILSREVSRTSHRYRGICAKVFMTKEKTARQSQGELSRRTGGGTSGTTL